MRFFFLDCSGHTGVKLGGLVGDFEFWDADDLDGNIAVFFVRSSEVELLGW